MDAPRDTRIRIAQCARARTRTILYRQQRQVAVAAVGGALALWASLGDHLRTKVALPS